MMSIFRSLNQPPLFFTGKVLGQNPSLFVLRHGTALHRNNSLHKRSPVLTAAIFLPLASEDSRSMKGRAVVVRRNGTSLHKFFSKGEDHGSSSNFWTLGAFLLAASIMQSVVNSEENKRIMSVDVLPANIKLTQPPSRLIKDPNHEGWFKINSKSLFSVRLTVNGQLIWQSFSPVGESDVKEIANFYRNLGDKRSLHINTGIHGGPAGQADVDSDSGTFTEEDIIMLKGYLRVSFHVVSSFSDPIPEERLTNVDILDAWCFSASTKDFSKLSAKGKASENERIRANSIPRYQLMGCFISAKDLGYPSTLISNISYTEMGSLKKDVIQRLNEGSFCYVRGIGGIGKSRVALEIEREIGNQIDQSNSEYDTSVFVSLKSASGKEDFLAKVREQVSERRNDVALKKYFSRLGDLATAHNKKIFLVVDNIDTDDDCKFLQDIFDSIKKFRKPDGDSIFKLLVTGRLSPSDFLTKNKLNTLKNQELTIAKYCTAETCWPLVVNSFLQVVPNEVSQKAKAVIEKKKETLLNLLKKLDYHPSVAALFSQTLARCYNLGTFEEDIGSLSSTQFKQVLAQAGDLSDYGPLIQAVEAQFKILDARVSGKASKIFEIFSLTSDGSVSYLFFRKIIEKYYKCESTVEFNSIFFVLESCGLVQRIAEGVYQMPPFYHTITQLILSDQYKSTASDIDTIFSIVLETIEKKQGESSSSKNTIDEQLKQVVGLFNSARHLLKVDNPLYDKISSRCTAIIAKDLRSLKFEDLQGKFNNLLLTFTDKPGSSLDPVVYRFIKGKELGTITDDLVLKAENVLREEKKGSKSRYPSWTILYKDLIPILVSFNNLYVIYRESKQDSSRIKAILDKLIRKWDYKNAECENLIDTIRSNIKDHKRDPQKLVMFPQIEFHTVSDQGRTKARDWKVNNHLDNKIANLSNAQLKDGLRVLIPYLLQEKETEVIDLSHNYFGWANSGFEVVGDLLKSPGSLKELRINNNSLNRGDSFGLIIDGLERNTSLEKLVLNNNRLADTHIKKLCDALRNHRKIKHVDLHYNCFTQTGIDHLRTLMHDNSNINLITTRGGLLSTHNVGILERDNKGNVNITKVA